ncbi:MAG: hypothetical protein AAF674_11170 [Pseudomonadota bacterium]
MRSLFVGILAAGLCATASAQDVEIWMFDGAADVERDGQTVSVERGFYLGCDENGCRPLPLSDAPPPPSTFASTDADLPADLALALQLASTPEDIAALILAYPGFAGAILRQAAALGVASPAQVVGVLGPSLTSQSLADLVATAVSIAPELAGSIATAAVTGGGDIAAIIFAAIQSLESSALDGDQVAAFAAGVAADLVAADAGDAEQIASIVAAATSDPNDTAETVLEALDGLESEDVADTPGADTPQIDFSGPSELQNQPSPN